MVDPVSGLIGLDAVPRQVGDGGCLDGGEFGFASEVVADVSIVDLSAAVRDRVGLFDEEGDGDGVAAALSECLPAFLPGLFAAGSGVASEVVDVDVVELIWEGEADAVRFGGGWMPI